MFRKPRRAYRVQRKEESDGEAEESPTDVAQTSETNPSAPIRSSGTKHSAKVDGFSVSPNITHEDETIKVRPLNRASSEQFSSMLKQGVIPDASTIHMVRKQRQQAKFQLEAEEENFSSPHPSSNDGRRLIREEDDDEEDDFEGSGANVYHHRRPAFTLSAEYRDPKSRRRVEISRGLQRRHEREQEDDKERRSMLEAIENASKNKHEEGDDDVDDDEADDTWERQQIQKAVSSKNTAVLEALEPLPSTDGGLLPKPSRRLADFGDVTLASIKSTLQER
ncbi:unnamed protein product [Hydatigera taeniaeformis]|uniref:GC-rich sequence DNA-binding factor n=1 Tax=Hydatigena taeniaeformis TaxID=6205 RepID=A0A0R3WRY6_HYDTA|nr:unnamed protein product [Hydatigera taeniaeformis]